MSLEPEAWAPVWSCSSQLPLPPGCLLPIFRHPGLPIWCLFSDAVAPADHLTTPGTVETWAEARVGSAAWAAASSTPGGKPWHSHQAICRLRLPCACNLGIVCVPAQRSQSIGAPLSLWVGAIGFWERFRLPCWSQYLSPVGLGLRV